MELYHIVAMSHQGLIGKENRLPWHSSADLKRFKKITLGNTIIMGRKTFESIGGRPLPGRENFVLSRRPVLTPPAVSNLHFFDSLEKAFGSVQTEKAFIIGGAELYHQTLDKVSGIYLTRVEGDYEGDTYYPVRSVEELEKIGFRVTQREKSAEDPKLEFIELKRTL